MRALHLPRPAAALAALTLLAARVLSGCGAGAGSGAGAHPTAATPPASAHYLAPSELRRDLSNGFRAGLYRLAVMSQPSDAATDLGQDLPTGTLGGVRCGAADARPTSTEAWRWHCAVRWTTVGGVARRTAYDVRLLPSGCFAAGATPRLPQHRDTTIASYSEHPLNAIVSARRGC